MSNLDKKGNNSLNNAIDEIGKLIIADYIKLNRQHPYIVGIAGCAGVGKSTFAEEIKKTLEIKKKKVKIIGFDDFFKSREERRKLGTEWDENHVRLEDLVTFFNKIKEGAKRIPITRYVRDPQVGDSQLIKEEVNFDGIDIIIFEGLYAISSEKRLGNLLQFVDFSIYLDAEISDIKEWRYEQETKKDSKKQRTLMEMDTHWEKGIVPDIKNNVAPSRKNAHLIIHFDSERNVSSKEIKKKAGF
ncbi:MAG: hypothetical protein GTO45_08525 [Candidatus Aminicenantes bacterium]|nr:hypothetical protein [Candidatus Aminicenantes bacterium]NIM78876.1 hypothetical protein [Candidatus Aminicenantes bacterium]NIN18132.1 hypothetical protein [Candidatus Aminicenantes bacterium]NIN42031.1 hypothetical protein [Candidatus Aminicenantes bacterium]NIN84787.1 hypothetical protein [Candidatus Aminicenantes bacterium]